VLGTVLQLRIGEVSGAAADVATWIVHEFARLERVFSVFDNTSDLRRWRSGMTDTTIRSELGQLLVKALSWQRTSSGVFNPAADLLMDLWADAELTGVVPTKAAARAAAHSIANAPYRVVDESIARIGDCESVSLNAIAKGHIVDLVAAGAAARFDIGNLIINAGGDVLHVGKGSQIVSIEDPTRPYDNADPLAKTTISNFAIATSGAYRREFLIDGKRFGHVIDARTGWPARAVASASATASDAATADVVATVLSVLGPAEGVRFADSIDGVGCLVVGHDRSVWSNLAWDSQQRGLIS